MVLIVSDEGVEGVEEHVVDQEVPDGPVLLLSVLDVNVVHLQKT